MVTDTSSSNSNSTHHSSATTIITCSNTGSLSSSCSSNRSITEPLDDTTSNDLDDIVSHTNANTADEILDTMTTSASKLHRETAAAAVTTIIPSYCYDDPVLFIAIVELDMSSDDLCDCCCTHTTTTSTMNNNDIFVTKLRIRLSDVVSNDVSTTTDDVTTPSDSSCTYTAQQLRQKTYQYLSDTTSTTKSSHQHSNHQQCESTNYSISIYDTNTNDYVLLVTPRDDSINLVQQYGTRWRIRVVLEQQQQPQQQAISHGKTYKAIEGRYYQSTKKSIMATDNTSQISLLQRYTIELQEISNLGHVSTGYQIWDGSILLTRYLEYYHPQLQYKYDMNQRRQSISFYKQRVLELGSGCGVVGISAILLGAQHVTCTDLDTIVPVIQTNIDHNQSILIQAYNDYYTSNDHNNNTCSRIDDIISCRSCDWTQPIPVDMIQSSSCRNGNNNNYNNNTMIDDDMYPPYDIILVADCVWMDHLVEPLLSTLKQLTDKNVIYDNNDVEAQGPTTIIDQFANQSISHLDFKLPHDKDGGAENDESPVNSWADIYRQQYQQQQQNMENSFGQGSSNGSMNMSSMELSYRTLRESPPPSPCDDQHVLSLYADHNKDLHDDEDEDDIGNNEQVVTDSKLPTVPEEGPIHLPVSHITSKQQGDINFIQQQRQAPIVYISYERRGKSTHEMFMTGLYSLFTHIEILDILHPSMTQTSSNNDNDDNNNIHIPNHKHEKFYLFKCQR